MAPLLIPLEVKSRNDHSITLVMSFFGPTSLGEQRQAHVVSATAALKPTADLSLRRHPPSGVCDKY